MSEDFFDRLDKYMTYSGLNDNKLTVIASLSVGAIGKQRKGSRGLSSDSIAKILYCCPDLSGDWLLTGKGEMLKEIFKTKSAENVLKRKEDVIEDINEDKPKVQKTSSNVPAESSIKSCGTKYDLGMRPRTVAAEPIVEYKTDRRNFALKTDRPLDNQRIPLYDLSATAGLVSLFIDSSHQVPVDYISIPGLPRCDGAVHVCGDSMYPLLKSGDIVVYKEVNDIINNIFWGEMYMVSFETDGDEYITIKYVQRSEDPECIRLVSYNTHHSPQEIKLSRVRALALIKASVRFNTMG